MSAYRRPVDEAALAANFRVFAEADCDAEPLYAALSRAVANAPEVLSLLMTAPYPQRRPVLLFAATHDLLLAGAAHPLGRFYPSVAARDQSREDVENAAGPFVTFCRTHRDALLQLLSERTVQTNETGRGAGLRLALATLPQGPIGLIDVGCSAGLNLLVDRYRFVYRSGDGSEHAEGPDAAFVVRASIVAGDPFAEIVGPPPPIEQRIGIDLSPLDVNDARDARWLRACVWPSDADRHARLAAAVAIGQVAPLDLRRGDASERVAELVDAVDRRLRPVVFHSWVLSYFDQPSKRRFTDAVRAMVIARDGAWISAESAGVVPGLLAPPLPPHAGAAEREATLWHVTTREGGRAVSRAVARSHPHCRWIEWLDVPPPRH